MPGGESCASMAGPPKTAPKKASAPRGARLGWRWSPRAFLQHRAPIGKPVKPKWVQLGAAALRWLWWHILGDPEVLPYLELAVQCIARGSAPEQEEVAGCALRGLMAEQSYCAEGVACAIVDELALKVD